MWKVFAILSLSAILVLTGCAQQSTGPQIKIEDAWARPSAGADMNGAIYFRIVNDGKEADKLISADTPSAQAAEVHESMADDNGVMSMKPRENVEVSAGEEVEFKPGGLHIMLVDLKQPLTAGDEVQLTLHFEKAGEIQLNVKVREP
jgi:copper(I)-binding protein